MIVFVKKMHENAEIPKQAFSNDAGVDVVACWVKETEDYIEYGSGLAFEIDQFESKDWYIKGYPRSSISKYDLVMANGSAIIDNGYRNEVTFRFKKVKDITKEIKSIFNNIVNIWKQKQKYEQDSMILEYIKKIDKTISFIKNYKFDDYKIYKVGDRIAQIMVEKRPKIEFIESQELNETDRGLGGFGSSGN